MTTTLNAKRRDLARLLDELEAGQKEMAGGPLSHARGEELDRKAREVQRLQHEIDLEDTLARAGRTPVDPHMPRRAQPNGKESGAADEGDPEAGGYVSLGQAFVGSDEFQSFMRMGRPKGDSAPMGVKSIHDTRVPLTKAQAAELKSLPSFSPEVIQPERIADRVRDPERARLRLRDVLTVSGTTAAAVSYVVYTYGEAAAPAPEATLKHESGLAFGTGLAPVRTIAVWIPVTEQMLEDYPVLASTINSELLYDVARSEELQLLYGDGTGENLLGLLDPKVGVPTIPDPQRAEPTNAQILDLVRMGVTDVTLRGGAPNACVLHPIEWEMAELTKGTEARYLWAVIRDRLGPRLWGLDVVESVHLAPPGGGDRTLIIGDFLRGATLFDRRASSISVGWINDQFVKNMRTIRAEERIAFAVKRPFFFAKRTVKATTP